MKRAASRDEAGGFVMLEALVALILLLFTVGLVASMLSFGQKVATKGTAREVVTHVANGSGALSAWLAGASPIRPMKKAGPGPVLFEGRADRLSFVTTSIGDVQTAGLQALTVGFGGRRADATGSMLFDAVPLGLAEAALPDQVAKTPLFGQVLSAQFSYFGSPRDGVPSGWSDQWSAATRLPRLVSLDTRVAAGSRVETFHLTFRVRPE